MVQNLKWATAYLSRRLGAGLGARHSDTARSRAGGARHAGGRWAYRARARLGVLGAGAAGDGACRASGCAGRAGARSAGAGRSAGGQAAARVAGAGMGARGTGRERAERAAWVRGARCLGVPVRAGWACWLVSWASFGAQCTWLSFDSVFDRFDSVFFLSH